MLYLGLGCSIWILCLQWLGIVHIALLLNTKYCNILLPEMWIVLNLDAHAAQYHFLWDQCKIGNTCPSILTYFPHSYYLHTSHLVSGIGHYLYFVGYILNSSIFCLAILSLLVFWYFGSPQSSLSIWKQSSSVYQFSQRGGHWHLDICHRHTWSYLCQLFAWEN